MVLASFRDTASSGTRVRGRPGLRADTGGVFKAGSFPGFLWSPIKAPTPAPEAPLGVVGITPSHGTPGPPDSRRPTPQVPEVAQAADGWCGQTSPEVPGEPTVSLLDEQCRESEPQTGRRAR